MFRIDTIDSQNVLCFKEFSKENLAKALEFIEIPQGDDVKIADIGCGSGGQTMTLAQKIRGNITAVDVFPEFLQKPYVNPLEWKIRKKNSS